MNQTHYRQAPGPKGKPILGNMPDLRRDFLGTMAQAHQKYGELVQLRIGPRVFYVASHPDLAQEILVNQKDAFVKISRPDGKPTGLQMVLGRGLLTNLDHDSWLSQRRMMQPIFHRQRILNMSEKISGAGERMLARWRKNFATGDTIHLEAEMMQVTLDIINQTMFSADVMDKVEKIGPAITVAVEHAFAQVQSPVRIPPSWPTPGNRLFKQAMGDLNEVIYSLIRERIASGEKRGDLLDMLLEARDEETGLGMDEQQVRDEATTIFGAGHETTANALTWTWYLLAQPQNREILEQLQAEVDTVLNGRSPSLADLPNLPYASRLFDESLRLYPPAPIVPRRIAQPIVLHGYPLKQNANVLVSINNIHRHPDFWPEPEKFDPERFTPENKKGRHRLAYMPFGAGPRLCIGNNFALMEGVLLLALMAQHYEFQLVAGHPVERRVAVTMRPKYGLLVTLQPRKVHGVLA